MKSFRKLSGNIFFKIFLAFIALSFVLFGISGFILGGSTSWVAKIGGKTITLSSFTKEMQKNRDMILQTNSGEEAQKYLESEKFKSDILNRMVNTIIIEKLRDNLGIQVSKDLILQEVAKDDNFKGSDGKFDRNAFQNFLKKNGIDEEKYVKIVQDEVAASMVVQTLIMTSPVNTASVIANAEFKLQTRLADVVKITAQNAGKIKAPSNEELTEFFEKNKKNYAAPEMRKVSYLKFSRKDFTKDMEVSDEEIAAEYEKNKEQLVKPESRDLYHVMFDKEEDAKDFIGKLNAKSDLKSEFAKLAKETQKKSQKDITISGVTQKDLIPELSKVIFTLTENKLSDPVKSPLGFHVFLLNKITKSSQISLAEVKNDIKNKLLEGRQEKVLQAKISAIDDIILSSNSLEKAAEKFNLKVSSNPVLINQLGQDANGKEVSAIASLENFAANSFSTKDGQSSKLFYSKTSDEFYAVKVVKVEESHDKKLQEIRSKVLSDLTAQMQYEKLQEFAKKVSDEIKENPSNANTIAKKYGLSVVRNKEFPRTFYINYQGRQIPYASKFLEELFTLTVGKATGLHAQGPQGFDIGILRSIKQPTLNEAQITQAKQEIENAFQNEVAQGYNSFMLKQYPIKINEKIFAKEGQQ
jgi:peptidyl-prolyl cis-trans isomerase D